METFIEGFRLSRQQRRVWLRQQHDQSSVYRVLCAVRIEGSLNRLLFREAIRTVFAGHEILRTRFECLPEMSLPLQVVESEVALQIDEFNFSHLEDQEVEIEKLFQQLRRDAIGRVVLVAQSATKHVLMISLPAVNADAKSLENLVDAIRAAYETSLLGEEWTSEACQFTQFSEWQNELDETDQDAWKQEIAACETGLSLPFERGATSVDFEPEVLPIDIAPGNFDVTFLLACWQAGLWRLSGQSEIVVGHVCDDRGFEELQTALGPFAETLPVYANLHANVQFSELRRQTAEAIAKASEWKNYFAWPEHSGEPRFIPFSFEFREAAITQADPSLTFSIFKYYICIDRFKIKLSVLQRADVLSAEFHYDSNLFRAHDIQRLARRFQALIASANNNPDATLAQLNMLSVSEREQIRREFNDTARPYPGDKLVFQLFEQQAEQNPNNIAAAFEDQRLTYQELNERANQLAHYLQSRGVGPEVRVGLCFERSPEMIAGLLGVMKAGGAYVPFEPSLPKERLEALLEDAQCSMLLTHESLAAEVISQQSKANLSSTISGANAAYVIFTSGSTGRPKGVVIEHRQLLAYVQAIIDRLELPAESSFAMVSTFAADLGHTATFPTLATGGCLHVISQTRVTDARLLSDYFTRHEIDCVKIVPSHLSTLLESFPEGQLLPRKRLVLGGEAAHWKLIEKVRERAPECRIYNHYGPTETTVGAVSGRVDSNQPETSVALGRPIANACVFIVKENLELALIGESGELCIGGQGVGRGYFNAADLTAEKFIPDPFSVGGGGRIYRTGDKARYLDNGSIEFLGRIDRQVKIRGFRVEPGEIESILVQHPQIREAAVVAIDSEPGGKRLVAYVVGERAELTEFLSAKLPDYMAPSTIVWLKELPLTTNGKIDYASLPAPDFEQDEQQFVAPRTAFEEMLCGIWTEVLHLERVSVVSDFFELGGHSLLVMLLVSRIRDVFGVEIPLGSVFDHPTVATLAAVIEKGLESDARPVMPPLQRVSRDRSLPLSFAQQRLWFINQMEPDSTVYNIPLAKRLVGSLDVSVLERALTELLRRHESLRTTFPIIDGEARQVIAAAAPLRLTITDLGDQPDVEAAAQQLVNEEAQQPFDLANGPLFRARLLRLDRQQHVLLFNLHHIVSDGWSMDLLFKELSLLHNAYERGEQSPLAEPEVQYADYAVWQREWLSGAVLENQLAYWKQQLSETEVLELPTDRPRPAMQSFKGSTESFRLPESLSRQLKELSQREGATLFMTLLAAFQILLSRYSGQQDVLVGTPILGRNRKEMEGVVGFFVNTLAIRANLDGAPTFREMLAQVKQTCLAAYAHQDIPFDRLVEELRPARSLSHQPLFQVLFQLQNGRRDRLSIDGLSIKSMKPQGETTKCDLMLALLDNDQELLGSIQYSTDLFDLETIQRMIGHFQNLLESAVADPAQPVAQLPLLAETERQQLLADWNDTSTGFPRDKCIHEMFEAQVMQTPEAIALIYKDKRLTYRELNERANHLAQHLVRAGVGTETIVGVMLERSPEMVIAL
ncbi:MAG TPA: amino acid adenylation domain-containing protein, partial [Pyrinomonadaceae bacterium]|nr:amino acid adenylation domain-containing protein [Pyrinomonadaceae bacterium]